LAGFGFSPIAANFLDSVDSVDVVDIGKETLLSTESKKSTPSTRPCDHQVDSCLFLGHYANADRRREV
jgi:hypothetical protein